PDVLEASAARRFRSAGALARLLQVAGVPLRAGTSLMKQQLHHPATRAEARRGEGAFRALSNLAPALCNLAACEPGEYIPVHSLGDAKSRLAERHHRVRVPGMVRVKHFFHTMFAAGVLFSGA